MNIEKLITFIVGAIVISAIIFMGAHFLARGYEGNLTSTSPAYAKLMENYELAISKKQDPNKLAQDGKNLLEGNQAQCAIINLKKATDLEPKYRDAWVWLGYAYLKNNQPQEAVNSLKKAEELDPIHADTFKLLATAYEEIGDEEASQKAWGRYQFLIQE